MSLLAGLKKLAVVLSDNTVLITDRVEERRDFIVVMGRPAPKSKLINVIIGRRRRIGYLVDMRRSSIKNELAQEVIRKRVIEQLVRGLTRKRFDFVSFGWGLIAGGVIGVIFGLLYPKLFPQLFGGGQPQEPQPITPVTPVTPELPNPFAPIANAIMVVGILAVAAYFGFKFYEKWRERW